MRKLIQFGCIYGNTESAVVFEFSAVLVVVLVFCSKIGQASNMPKVGHLVSLAKMPKDDSLTIKMYTAWIKSL